MSKGEQLADRFEQINNEFISVVENYPDDRWQSKAFDEDRPVNVIAHHVGLSHAQVATMVKTIAEGGQLPPVTWEMIDQGNAAQAVEIAGAAKHETLQLLRSGGKEAAATLRSLSDEQLARTGSTPAFGEQPWTAEEIVERVLIGHPTTHLVSIKGSSAEKSSTTFMQR